MTQFDLMGHKITVAEIYRNLPPSALYEHAIRHERESSIAENGALVAIEISAEAKIGCLQR
jgi:phosphoenolpyruvate carboxykinase (ATP)